MSSFEVLQLPTKRDHRGALTVMEGLLPFEIARTFWIYDADEQVRGGHRHHVTRMGLLALTGTVHVSMNDGRHKSTIVLKQPDQVLLVEPEDWHEMRFEPGSVLVVFASHTYDAADYIVESYE